MWFMMGGLHEGRGMTMGWNSQTVNGIDLALPWDAQTQLVKDTTLLLVAKT